MEVAAVVGGTSVLLGLLIRDVWLKTHVYKSEHSVDKLKQRVDEHAMVIEDLNKQVRALRAAANLGKRR